MYYLEHCRVLVNGTCVEYVTDSERGAAYWNIPLANTTVVMLGIGTSVTQAAMREFARAGVMVGFCGNMGSPLLSGAGGDLDVAWFPPQSEYRPTEYLQKWVALWFDEDRRLSAAKEMQRARTEATVRCWPKFGEDFPVMGAALAEVLAKSRAGIEAATTSGQLLASEGDAVKRLYGLAASAVGLRSFTRVHDESGADRVNRLLNHGNYLAYGLAASVLWVLGLPHGLALLHGKTRRGALVFDVADVVKDAIVLPCAFVCAAQGSSASDFRARCMREFADQQAFNLMVDALKRAMVAPE